MSSLTRCTAAAALSAVAAVTEACERYAYYSLRAVLTLYLRNELGFSATSSTSISLYSQALAYFMPLLGGYASDTYWGKYTTIIRFSLVYVVGSATLALTAFGPWAWGCFLGLLLIAVGTGGIKPCVSAFGADQFAGEYGKRVPHAELEREVGRFFHAFYFAINVGSVSSFILSPLLRSYVGYWMAFGLPAIFLCIATAVFWSARDHYVKYPAQGSVLTPMLRALWTGYQHRDELRLPANAGKTWIDMSLGRDGVQQTDVAHAKAFWRILPFFAVIPAFWMLSDH